MMATPEEILAKSKALFDAGDVEGAKRLARIAKGRMAAAPDVLYGQEISSNYQGQSLKLAKQFKPLA